MVNSNKAATINSFDFNTLLIATTIDSLNSSILLIAEDSVNFNILLIAAKD